MEVPASRGEAEAGQVLEQDEDVLQARVDGRPGLEDRGGGPGLVDDMELPGSSGVATGPATGGRSLGGQI